MILDKDTARPLSVLDWPTIADIKTGVVKKDIDEATDKAAERILDFIFNRK